MKNSLSPYYQNLGHQGLGHQGLGHTSPTNPTSSMVLVKTANGFDL